MLRASAGSIKLTSVYGSLQQQDGPAARAGSPASQPYSHLLEIDGVRILLDCGWDDKFDVSYLEQLHPFIPTVDAVLISSPELCSCGALPYVIERLKPGAFVAAPVSTSKMGVHGLLHPFLYQFPNTHDFTVRSKKVTTTGEETSEEVFMLNVDKIYSAFRSVREPYGRDVIVTNKDVSIKCTAIFSGRMLGGHGWHIKYQIDELFYCPDFSIRPSYALKHFNAPSSSNIVCVGSFAFQPRPVLAGVQSTSGVISGIGAGAAAATAKFEEQLQNLFKDIQHTLRGGSNVLIPTNVPGRGLDILSTIVHLLQEKGGDNYKVVLASLQAQELMDKAATMTEALQDEVMLGDRALFTNVVPCRTAEEVLLIAGPKVCVADGASLDFGISAELLPHFLTTEGSMGVDNLIVLTEIPTPGTNAFAVAQTPQRNPLSYKFVKRSRLNKEELEEYYVQQEREVEAMRQRLLDEGTFGVEKEAADDDAGESDDDNDYDRPAAALGAEAEDAKVPSSTRKDDTTHGAVAESKRENTPGLVLPSYLHFKSKFLCFPTLETSATLAAAVMDKVNVAYGLLVTDDEQIVIRKLAPTRKHGDEEEGLEALKLKNDAQVEANIPSKVREIKDTRQKDCKVVLSDLSGYPDAASLRSLIKTKFVFAKKIVSIRGNAACWRPLAQFCRNEKTLKCGENVFMLRGPAAPLELATHVLSYTVQLDPELAQQLPYSLKRVRETHSQGAWDVGWVNGELRGMFDTNWQSSARPRHEEPTAATALTLSAVHGARLQQCAEEREDNRLQSGSFFVGKVELGRLRDDTRKATGLISDFQKKSPMLVFDHGTCVRKGATGTVTIASVAAPSMFQIRQSVYKQFAQTL